LQLNDYEDDISTELSIPSEGECFFTVPLVFVSHSHMFHRAINRADTNNYLMNGWGYIGQNEAYYRKLPICIVCI
jgi:hypothetical protein